MDFDEILNMATAPRGRPAKPIYLNKVRDLLPGEADEAEFPRTQELGPVQKLRETHHRLARILADGTKYVEAAAISGYTPQRITMLMGDPAFQELVEYYRTQKEAKYLDVHERLAALGMSVVDELQDRLEVKPDDFTNKELRELATFALDRSVTKGAAPQQGTPVVQVTFVGNGSPSDHQQITAGSPAPAALGAQPAPPIIDLPILDE